MGVDNLPDDERLVPMMQAAVAERGFYFFPGMDTTDTSPQAMEAWAERYTAGPRGVLIYDPEPNVQAMSPAMLATEFAANVSASILLTIVLASIPGSVARRAGIAGLLGVFAWTSILVSYWNWYRFPADFARGAFLDETIGWLLAGGAIALVLAWKAGQPADAS
jgi:hypothetical protein